MRQKVGCLKKIYKIDYSLAILTKVMERRCKQPMSGKNEV
jgi:hypothetical protein